MSKTLRPNPLKIYRVKLFKILGASGFYALFNDGV